MRNPNREAFERWATKQRLSTSKKGGEYIYTKTRAAWIGWQAAKIAEAQSKVPALPGEPRIYFSPGMASLAWGG